MNPLEYLHLQLRLEGKVVIGADRLRQVEVVPGEDMPLMLLAQLTDGQLVAYYDEALGSDLRTELAKHAATIAFPAIEPLLSVLKARTISVQAEHYKTYSFPPSFREFSDPDVVSRPGEDLHVQSYCIGHDGKIVSSCVSSREDSHCAEAWVYTDEAYRRQGFAHRVVRAWAQAIFAAGRVPLYSHKISNLESARLAKRLGLQPVFEEIGISYANQ